ncbi:4Fe-4S dicluster domain-containing protein [Geobacter sp. DSM 9736]|uniref:4Fe-4S dicluster domain-containing protein n=1 Tax=Geobacter sp. DSM 9736 TaxID=1277350 RepID=UPI000B4FDBBE|nr:4Fe-4S dicluster domain-containing protein [Geobacter sp. DSM 9736]SNB46023.1 4Fe-4S dicluster containing protein [Geobacter sp. DSM 9736]
MRFLQDIHLPRFIEHLSDHGVLHGPIRTDDGVLAFRPLRSPGEIQHHYSRTLLPPKKYLLPPREKILEWSEAAGYMHVLEEHPPIVLYGLHPCDVAGIAYLDKMFLHSDQCYEEKRKALILVSVSCEPDQFCFCGATGSCSTACGDIHLEAGEGGFYIHPAGEIGDVLLASSSSFLEDREPPRHEERSFPGEAPIKEAVACGEKFNQSPLWDEFADRCLSCGACSLCCPTCYCFDIKEHGDLDGSSAPRLREWDNCLFRSHGEIAGGTNFRLSRRERFRYRYQHKYLGFGPSRGLLSCVGCGRCREVCPVEIDLLRLFEEWKGGQTEGIFRRRMLNDRE